MASSPDWWMIVVDVYGLSLPGLSRASMMNLITQTSTDLVAELPR
jgi:hypothetical protein